MVFDSDSVFFFFSFFLLPGLLRWKTEGHKEHLLRSSEGKRYSPRPEASPHPFSSTPARAPGARGGEAPPETNP